MIIDIDGQARPNYSMYGQFPQSHGSTPHFLYIYAEYAMIISLSGTSDVNWDSTLGSRPHEIGDLLQVL